MQVNEPEGHVGLPLFERNGRQVALTTAGEYMLVDARKVIATLKDAEDAAARLQRLEVGTLTIGMVSTAKYCLPRLLAEFQHEHEGAEIRLAVGNREQRVKMLHGNEVDIAVMGRPPKELATRAEPFAEHPLLKVGHPTVDSLRPCGPAALRLHPARARIRHARRDGKISGDVAHGAARGDGDGQQRNHQAGHDGRDGHQFPVAAHHRSGAGTRPDRHTGRERHTIIRAWNVVHTLSKLLSPAAGAFRYFMLERAESHLAEKYGRLLKLPPAPSVG